MVSAFPTTEREPSRVRRWHDRREAGRQLRIAARVWAPPSPERFAAFGRSTIFPPFRVSYPDCVAIGDGVVIYEDVWLSVVRDWPDIRPRLVIEDGVEIGRGAAFAVAGTITIEAGARIGDFSLIADTYHPYEVADRLPASVRPVGEVRIGAGAVLGSHVVVLPGITIGAGAYVDHHAVVGKDVAPGTVVAGYPARRRRERPTADER